jgi:hypothetical protein
MQPEKGFYMRKIALFILMTLLVAVGAVSAQPVPTSDLSTLAQHYDDDTLFFASVRTDEAFFQEIDALVTRTFEFLPESQRPDGTLLEALNQELQADTGQTLDEAIFPWLGDTAAIGVPGMTFAEISQSDELFYLAFEIDDPDGAVAYLESVIDNPTITEQNDFTLIEGVEDGLIAVGMDVLFLAASDAGNMLPLSGVESPLSENAQFTDTLALLPAEGYNAIAYVNTGEIQRLTFEAAEAEGESIPGFLAQFTQVTTTQAFGATIQDNSALILDIAQTIDTSVYDEFGIETYRPGAVDLSFAERIPADAPLVIHSAEFGPSLQSSLDNLRAVGDYIQQSETLADLAETGQGFPLSPQERAILNNVDPAWLIGAFNVTFAGLTGLSFERDVLTTLNQDIAVYLRVIPSEGFPVLPVVPDFGVLFQTDGAEATDTLVQSLVDAFAAYDLDYATEPYGSGQALVIDQIGREFGQPIPQLDALIGGSDDVFAIGTRSAVEAALDTSGGLAASETFTDAGQYLLSEPTSVAYLNLAPLLSIVNTLVQQQQLPADAETAGILRVLSIIESATISANSPAEGVGVSRAVITLSDEPFELITPDQAALPAGN